MVIKLVRGACIALVASVASVATAGDAEVKLLTQEAFLALPKQGPDAPFVLDVRTPEEFATGYVPGAVNIPHDQLASRLAEVPRDREIVLYCRSGRRTLIAAEVLAASGYGNLDHLEGDIMAWVDKGRPITRPRDPAACIAALKSGDVAARACASN